MLFRTVTCQNHIYRDTFIHLTITREELSDLSVRESWSMTPSPSLLHERPVTTIVTSGQEAGIRRLLPSKSQPQLSQGLYHGDRAHRGAGPLPPVLKPKHSLIGLIFKELS